jgi:hypothetical protein
MRTYISCPVSFVYSLDEAIVCSHAERYIDHASNLRKNEINIVAGPGYCTEFKTEFA